jgi:excisionase family DNA binding protein
MLIENEKRLMTVVELASRLNVSRAFVYVLISEQGLPRVKLGRAVRFRWDEVEVWLSKRSLT